MKIFLSHKSADKTLLRDYAKTLEGLGFQPWLDEDAMHAGVNLERGLLDGFEQSCAVVFFITENFLDKDYLATEVDYAIRQKRAKGDRFS
ncbi:toll/interleukin-1 receptor domain-containing protein, partial [Acinetobacter baumannii]